MAIPGSAPSWTAQPHSGFQVNTTAMSADGSVLLTGTSLEYSTSDQFGVYCYTPDGNAGRLLWSDPLDRDAQDGVFWAAVSADGRYGAAGGSYTDEAGFLRLYSIANGPASRQEFSTSGRVNEVEMSADGSMVLAVYNERADLYQLVNGSYRLAGSQTFAGFYLRTCGITPDGTWAVVGGDVDTDTGDVASPDASNPGIVAMLLWDSGSLQAVGRGAPGDGVRRVVISGRFVAASTRSGTISLWSRVMGPVWQHEWTFSPTPPVGIIYALAIAQPDEVVWIGAGGNATGPGETGGKVFVVQGVPNDAGFTPKQLWMNSTVYPPNPATGFDAQARCLTAADGDPTKAGETKGNFYLFNAQTGQVIWSLETSLMNWSMVINPAATACFGGSDDGLIYYWGSPTGQTPHPPPARRPPRAIPGPG